MSRSTRFGFSLIVMALAGGCADRPVETAASSAPASRQLLDRGAAALHAYGCGSCHRIPGMASADGSVGPPLVNMRRRVYIGRGLPNTPQNMARWIQVPQQFAPGSAMPDMQVSGADAQAITAYLWQRD